MLQGKTKELTKKYGTTGFMYTEYPHKRFWNRLDIFHKRSTNESMLYVHIPYCPKLCYFCTCHMSITNDYSKIKHYLEYLYKEIEFVQWLKPNIKEIHLGGGSPTMLNKYDFKELVKKLSKLVDIKTLDEFALEIDPRTVDRDMINFYADMGINRISFGIQDFNVEVQEAINRIQPVECIENLLVPEIRSRFKNGVNFDIICGLPKQTVDSIKNTCYEIVRLSPDRVCLNYLHYSPEMAKHQTLMGDLPDFQQRKELFTTALEVLTLGGYVRTGYDHFAKPTDANAKSTVDGNVVWNSMGTTPGRVQDVIGVGVSSISCINNHYFQNFYELSDYEEALDNGKFPTYRGHTLTEDDILRRGIIQSLRNYFTADISGFFDELKILKEFEQDNIVTLSGTRITIIQPEYANLVCRVFDKFYEGNHFTPDLGER